MPLLVSRFRRFVLWLVLLTSFSSADAKGLTDQQAFEDYLKRAEKGDGGAIYSLGLCYWYGRGVAKDPVEAYAYWNLRGMSDRVDARYVLQSLEAEKEITPEIRARGRLRTTELQEKLDAKAGPGGPPSVQPLTYEQLFADYMGMVEQGNMGYLYSVGLCYAEGLGVKKDLAEAYAYWSLRSMSGRQDAQDARRGLYLLGQEISPEDKRRGQQRLSTLQKEIEDKVRAYKNSLKSNQ
jgi:TPR repeat protein